MSSPAISECTRHCVSKVKRNWSKCTPARTNPDRFHFCTKAVGGFSSSHPPAEPVFARRAESREGRDEDSYNAAVLNLGRASGQERLRHASENREASRASFRRASEQSQLLSAMNYEALGMSITNLKFNHEPRVWSGANGRAYDRSRHALPISFSMKIHHSNVYLVATFGVDTAENDLSGHAFRCSTQSVVRSIFGLFTSLSLVFREFFTVATDRESLTITYRALGNWQTVAVQPAVQQAVHSCAASSAQLATQPAVLCSQLCSAATFAVQSSVERPARQLSVAVHPAVQPAIQQAVRQL